MSYVATHSARQILFQNNLSWSTRVFVEVILPIIQSQDEFAGFKFFPVEGETSKRILELLDQNAGIDLFAVNDGFGVRAMASRVQRIADGKMAYKTFTIRLKTQSGKNTEYQKRLFALENEYLIPYWTLQAYVRQGTEEPLTIVVCKTADLYGHIIDKGGPTGFRILENPIDGTKFFAVNASDLPKETTHIWDFTEDEPPF